MTRVVKWIFSLREYRHYLENLHRAGYKWLDGDSLLSDFIPGCTLPFKIIAYKERKEISYEEREIGTTEISKRPQIRLF